MSRITDRAVRAVTRAVAVHVPHLELYCQADSFPLAGYWHGPRCDGLPCQVVTALADNDELAYTRSDAELDDHTALQARVTVLRASGALSGVVAGAVVEALWSDWLLNTAVVRLPGAPS